MVNMRTVQADDLEENIKNSDFFVAFANADFFKSARCAAQCEIATHYKKKFIIVARYNLRIPESFIDDIKHGYKIIRYSHINQAKQRLADYIKTDKINVSVPYTV